MVHVKWSLKFKDYFLVEEFFRKNQQIILQK